MGGPSGGQANDDVRESPFSLQLDSAAIDSSIPVERSKVIRSLLHRVTARATKVALERADRNCISIRVFRSPVDLQNHLASLGDPYTKKPTFLQFVYGVYERRLKTLLLADFDTDSKDYEQYIAQEFAHAVDGPDYELSKSITWANVLPTIKESPHFDLRQVQQPHESFAQALVLAYTEGYDYAGFAADDLELVGEALRGWGLIA